MAEKILDICPGCFGDGEEGVKLNLWGLGVNGHGMIRPRMNTNEHESEILDSLVEAVIGAAYEVSNVLGAGFLEKVYERALARELTLRGLTVRTQVAFAVCYKGQPVGEYVGDLVVDNRILVELKCVDRFGGEHTAQCINYLKASGLRLALMFNFQKPKVEWKRLIYG